jgi:hypothetical protein
MLLRVVLLAPILLVYPRGVVIFVYCNIFLIGIIFVNLIYNHFFKQLIFKSRIKNPTIEIKGKILNIINFIMINYEHISILLPINHHSNNMNVSNESKLLKK